MHVEYYLFIYLFIYLGNVSLSRRTCIFGGLKWDFNQPDYMMVTSKYVWSFEALVKFHIK